MDMRNLPAGSRILGRGEAAILPRGEQGWPLFFTEPVEDAIQSKLQGRPIYKEVAFCRIITPGDKRTNVVYSFEEPGVEQMLKGRYPQEYEAFKKGEENVAIGTPLKMWPQMTRARVMELNAVHIFTIEQLASVSDGNLPTLGRGSRAERDAAVAYLQAAAGTADVTKMARELAELRDQIEFLKQRQTAPSNLKIVEPVTPPPQPEAFIVSHDPAVEPKPYKYPAAIMQRAQEIANGQQPSQPIAAPQEQQALDATAVADAPTGVLHEFIASARGKRLPSNTSRERLEEVALEIIGPAEE